MNLRSMRLRPVLLALLAVAMAAAVAAAIFGRERGDTLAERRAEQPPLLLVTSLPLIFAERFSLEGGSPALEALETRYRVTPIGVTDSTSLRGGRLLLMAHPLAQPAEALIDLDRWVRSGGRALILADPRLDWPSERPLGDLLRPPPAFADTGLLAHWGLRLDSPESPGPANRRLAGRRILASSPGTLFGDCAVSRDRFVARCRIGNGAATVVADADFLNVDRLGAQASDNLEALLLELDQLERR